MLQILANRQNLIDHTALLSKCRTLTLDLVQKKGSDHVNGEVTFRLDYFLGGRSKITPLCAASLYGPSDCLMIFNIGKQGMDVLEGQPKLPSALEEGLENEVETSDEVELDLTPGRP